jgi:hypothetical protein
MTWISTERRLARKSRRCYCLYCQGKTERLGAPPRISKIGIGKELDELAVQIGSLVLNLPRASEQAGHTGPWGTLLDYVKPDPKQDFIYHEAAEFLKDLFCLSTDQMMHKWFRGPPPDVEPWETLPMQARRRVWPRKVRKDAKPKVQAKATKPSAPYCVECTRRNHRFRAIRDNLCALHLSRRDAALSQKR